MAKLNGVKTVDMANGEITKVAYDGAEYVKVDGEAQAGDIFFETSGNNRVSEGVYYQVVGLDNVNDPEFIDDTGETNAIDQDVPPYNLYYRKVSAKPSQLQVGDAVKVSIPDGEIPAYGWGLVENGDVGKVISVNGGDVFVEFPTHSIWNGRLTELVKIVDEKPSELSERVASLEERVTEIEKGIEVPAVEIDGVTYVKVTDRKPEAGDYVMFSKLPEYYEDCFSLGEYYEITEIDDWEDPQIIDDEGDSYDLSDDNFEVYEKIGTNPETVKVGDYAKVANYGTHRSMKDGDIVKITETDRSSGFTTGAKRVSDDYYEVYEPNQLIKVTDAEVAEAKLAEQFTKLGRKPNEFKEGDIAKVIDSPSASPNGTLIEIMAVYDAHVIGRGWCAYLDKVSAYGYDLNGHIELIAPVESRVDVKVGVSQ